MRGRGERKAEGHVIHAADFGSACSGIEHEDEVYSERQLADSADPVKSEKPLSTGGPPVPTALDDGNADNKKKKKKEKEAVSADVVAEQPAIAIDDDAPKKSDLVDRPTRPLAVTASIFQRSSAWSDGCKDGSRKDNDFSRSAQNDDKKTFVGVRALKESLKETVKEWKENKEPAAATAERQENCRPSFASTPFIFQVTVDIRARQKRKIRDWLIQQAYVTVFVNLLNTDLNEVNRL